MSKQKQFFKLSGIILEEIYEQEKYNMGKILTIIDASIPDKEQRKGIKDLIKESIKNTFTRRICEDNIRRYLFDFCEVNLSEAIQGIDKRRFMENIGSLGGQMPEGSDKTALPSNIFKE